MPACQLLLFEIPKRMSIEFYGEVREKDKQGLRARKICAIRTRSICE